MRRWIRCFGLPRPLYTVAKMMDDCDQLCVGFVAFALGDEGGPLVWKPSIREFKDVLYGIGSFADGDCTSSGVPAIFSFIKSRRIRRWVKKTISA